MSYACMCCIRFPFPSNGKIFLTWDHDSSFTIPGLDYKLEMIHLEYQVN
uniref:Uncharacterized protein n=1 Tax=Rhizophora mucronata TaxID=61149 RepID=A0A2P2NW79_RHIMU